MEDQLKHFETMSRTLDRENTQLKRAFEIMYPLVLQHGKDLSPAESELLLLIKYPKHGRQ
jgi:hypothetical protein